jgi:hypothetical protein
MGKATRYKGINCLAMVKYATANRKDCEKALKKCLKDAKLDIKEWEDEMLFDGSPMKVIHR